MNKRNLIFIGALAISYLFMVAFLSYQYPEQVNILMQATFGIVMVGVAVIGVLLSKGPSKKKGGRSRVRLDLFAVNVRTAGLICKGRV